MRYRLPWIQRPISVSLAILLLGRCGTMTPTPAPTVPLTVSEEVAIYTVLFERLGLGHIDALDPETNRGGFLREGKELDCDSLQAWLLQDMPDIIPEIIPAFCAINAVQRPVKPEVIRLMNLNTVNVTTMSGLRVSSIQTDVLKRQALVFVEIHDGDFLRTVYVLLVQKNGVWTVRYQES